MHQLLFDYNDYCKVMSADADSPIVGNILRRSKQCHENIMTDAILTTVMCYAHSTDGATSAKKVQTSNLSN